MPEPNRELRIPFRRAVKIPYRYDCGNCGRTVEGDAEISATYVLHQREPDEWEKWDDPHKKAAPISQKDLDYAEETAAIMLDREVGIWKRQTAGGNYSILAGGCSCPYCGAVQRWNYSARRTFIGLAVCVLLLGLGVLFLATSAGSTWEGGTDTARLLWGIVFAAAGVMAGVPVLVSLLGKKGKGQRSAPPVLFWEKAEDLPADRPESGFTITDGQA